MRLQVIQDSKGKTTGVFIPINDWNDLKKQYKDLETLEQEDLSSVEILGEIKEALIQLKMAEQGKLNLRPAKSLLDEL
jgi:hypothetical protein